MPVNREVQLRKTFINSAKAVVHHLEELGPDHHDRLSSFIEGIASNGLVLLGSSERYDQDLEAATRNAMRRPFGIETNTLSPNVQLILYPRMIYPPTEEYARKEREAGYEIRTEGSQAMLYILDGFSGERSQVENIAANLLFTGHMTGALLEGRYPTEAGEKSPEFLQQVKEALGVTTSYVRALDEAGRGRLYPRIARLYSLEEEGLNHEAHNFVVYQVEPLKTQGLFEAPRKNLPIATPALAVEQGTLYLHVSERDLPLRKASGRTKDVPAAPWQEFGRNRWNREHQLHGRYQLTEGDQILLVDFRLDSTHMPAEYGYFDTLEIALVTPESIRQHIVLGQEIYSEKEELLFLQAFGGRLPPEKDDIVFPIVVAGDFGFSEPTVREQLGLLANDKGVKPDVGRVLADVLKITSDGNLQKVAVK